MGFEEWFNAVGAQMSGDRTFAKFCWRAALRYAAEQDYELCSTIETIGGEIRKDYGSAFCDSAALHRKTADELK